MQLAIWSAPKKVGLFEKNVDSELSILLHQTSRD